MGIQFPKDNTKDLLAFYGNPDPDQDGNPNAAWEATNLVYVPVPWTIYHTIAPTTPYTKGIRVHKKCADSLKQVIRDIWTVFDQSQAEIEKVGLHQFGGGYYYRKMRGSTRISCHAVGCAIDWDPLHNVMDRGVGKMDKRVVQCFEQNGWVWLGPTHDPMHFQATYSVAKPRLPKPIAVLPPARQETPHEIHPSGFDMRAINMIKHFEAFMPHAYQDGPRLAIGYGHTFAAGTPDVTADMIVTEKEASEILVNDLTRFWARIAPFIHVQLTPAQQGACLSLAYNIGAGGFLASSLLKALNAGDYVGASKEFDKWTKSGGKVLPGLVRRRGAERDLFLSK
jgi:lysozyme